MRVPASVTLAVTILTRYFLNSQERASHVPERGGPELAVTAAMAPPEATWVRHPVACHGRATCRGAQGIATVTHGHVGADDQARRLRRSAAKQGDRTSRLVMRVRRVQIGPGG